MNKEVPILFSRDAAEDAPFEPGRHSAILLQHGSMELRWLAPKDTDRQTPHDRDEIYVVIAGRGWFVRGEQRVPFRTDDVLFVPANQSHRFEDFTPDLAVWVIFYGPPGGEKP